MATTTPFDLAPHEWPPSAEGELEGFADEVFETKWKGKHVKIAARCVPIRRGKAYHILFRFEGDVTSRIVAHPHKMPQNFYLSLKEDDVVTAVKHALR